MFTRYAIYYTPNDAFASAGAAWLGWDVGMGQEVAHPEVAGLDMTALTERPRKYGFHGTVKAPFALAAGRDVEGLRAAVRQLCSDLSAVQLDGLEVATLGRFLALVPLGDQAHLRDMAAQVVRKLDPFRGTPSDAELARRRKANLSTAQEANLTQWGYPHVMDQFRFHMTLTGPVSRGDMVHVQSQVTDHFNPFLPAPFIINALSLAGEGPDGHFVEIERFNLTSTS